MMEISLSIVEHKLLVFSCNEIYQNDKATTV